MPMEDLLIMQLFQSISVAYIAIVCLLTYGINKTITGYFKLSLSRNAKCIISLAVSVCMAIYYIYELNASIETVLLSALICTFGYDLIFKPIIKKIEAKFNIDNN